MLATSLRSNTKMGRILHQSATNSQIWSVAQHEPNKCSVDSSSSQGRTQVMGWVGGRTP
ncbi:hypothetical protein Hanom_Chr12g01109271 [Helianthus anomalus]